MRCINQAAKKTEASVIWCRCLTVKFLEMSYMEANEFIQKQDISFMQSFIIKLNCTVFFSINLKLNIWRTDIFRMVRFYFWITRVASYNT